MKREDQLMMRGAAGVCLAVALSTSCVAAEQAWPVRPIRFIVPYAAGGGTDSLGRMIAQQIGRAHV